MQCHEGRFRCVDRLEALAGAESRDGQQPALVSGVPEIPLSAPRGLEQRHLHHVDHALSPNVRRYITFSLFDSIRANRLISSRILIWETLPFWQLIQISVYPDIRRSTYAPSRSCVEEMPSKAMRHCTSSMPGVISSASRRTTSSSTN